MTAEAWTVPDLTVFARDHRWRLYVAAARILGPCEEAEEVVQEVLYLAATRRESFASAEHMLGWAVLHAKGRARDLASLRGNRPTVPYEDVPDRSGGDPADILVGREEAERVRVALASLSARQRDAVLAVDVEGMTYAEAAAHLGMDVSTLTPLLQRARRRLRRLLTGILAVLLPGTVGRDLMPVGMACAILCAGGASAPALTATPPAPAEIPGVSVAPSPPHPVSVPKPHVPRVWSNIWVGTPDSVSVPPSTRKLLSVSGPLGPITVGHPADQVPALLGSLPLCETPLVECS